MHRALHGMMKKEACSKLTTLLQGSHDITLQEHATKSQQLVLVEYGDLPERHHPIMLLDIFSSWLGIAYL